MVKVERMGGGAEPQEGWFTHGCSDLEVGTHLFWCGLFSPILVGKGSSLFFQVGKNKNGAERNQTGH